MATGRSRGPASRPPRRPGGGRPRASTRGAATAAAPAAIRRRGGAAASPRRPRTAAPAAARCCCRSSRSSWCCSARPSRPTSASAATSRRSRTRWPAQQQDVADPQGRAGALARPGLRRAAGPAAAEVRQAGRAVLHRARRRSRPPAPRPRARAGRARRAAALVRHRVAVHPHRRRARGAPVTARADLPQVAQADLDAVSRQLGRQARGVAEVAHRCPCGEPDVVRTEPRLPDGTPFPTSFYATCPRLTGALSTLESQGVMREMTERLEADPELRERLRRGAPRLPRAPLPARRRARGRRGLRRRHAGPGQVPARAGRPTRSPPGPGSTRSATRRSRCSTPGGSGTRARPTPRTRPTTRRMPAARRERRHPASGGRHRLRHQLAAPARRRRR